MGHTNSTRRPSYDATSEVNFDHFQILRAIGKGSFGKVCIVRKKDTRQMYAMKYMNKNMCIKKDAVRNVFSEVDLLKRLDHPFLVNLWFTFQDEEDMFIVVDLLLGGDLRYHMQQDVLFGEDRVKLYICEIALALDYLRQQMVLHRDLKPDNILLDEEGHVHITDFNVATQLNDGKVVSSMSGTKPYIAPEVFLCALNERSSYSFPVDWWALGVTAYEMLRGKRPYEIHSTMSTHDTGQVFTNASVHYPTSWGEGMKQILKRLLAVDPDLRISSLSSLQSQLYMTDMDFNQILLKKVKPSFVPSKDHLNCDPSYELEEMIIESNPLHKKKKRLAKNQCKRDLTSIPKVADPANECLDTITAEFKPYNRQRDCNSSCPTATAQIITNVDISTKIQL